MKKYEAIYQCVRCEHILTFHEVMNRHGVCPYCGNLSDSTIIKTKKTPAMVELNKLNKPPFLNFGWKNVLIIISLILCIVGLFTGAIFLSGPFNLICMIILIIIISAGMGFFS